MLSTDAALTLGLAGLHAAQRGDYRSIYAIDDAQQVVEISAVEHRADVYRRRQTHYRPTREGEPADHGVPRPPPSGMMTLEDGASRMLIAPVADEAPPLTSSVCRRGARRSGHPWP